MFRSPDLSGVFFFTVQGFRLVFHFARNPYFVNSEITKEFYIQNFVRGEKVLLRTDGYGID